MQRPRSKKLRSKSKESTEQKSEHIRSFYMRTMVGKLRKMVISVRRRCWGRCWQERWCSDDRRPHNSSPTWRRSQPTDCQAAAELTSHSLSKLDLVVSDNFPDALSISTTGFYVLLSFSPSLDYPSCSSACEFDHFSRLTFCWRSTALLSICNRFCLLAACFRLARATQFGQEA